MSTMLFKRLTKLQQYKHLYLASVGNRHCSIKTDVLDQALCTKYEITNNPDEWKYVERILPPKLVPEPQLLTDYPSGWKPQRKDIANLPYYVGRTRNHMIPVYLTISHRGAKRLTYVKKIEGDIWLLEKKIVEFLQQDQVRPIRSQVNEMHRCICLHGDYVNAIKYYLMKNDL